MRGASVVGHEESFAALVNLVAESEAHDPCGGATFLGGPLICFWRDFWRGALDRNLARCVTD
jgi:hypothetical protein